MKLIVAAALAAITVGALGLSLLVGSQRKEQKIYVSEGIGFRFQDIFETERVAIQSGMPSGRQDLDGQEFFKTRFESRGIKFVELEDADVILLLIFGKLNRGVSIFAHPSEYVNYSYTVGLCLGPKPVKPRRGCDYKAFELAVRDDFDRRAVYEFVWSKLSVEETTGLGRGNSFKSTVTYDFGNRD